MIQYAQAALVRGDSTSARQWAELCISVRPDREEAWLILAEISKPRLSLVYLSKALQINPQSERAQASLQLAQRLLSMPQVAESQPLFRQIERPFIPYQPNLDITHRSRLPRQQVIAAVPAAFHPAVQPRQSGFQIGWPFIWGCLLGIMIAGLSVVAMGGAWWVFSGNMPRAAVPIPIAATPTQPPLPTATAIPPTPIPTEITPEPPQPTEPAPVVIEPVETEPPVVVEPVEEKPMSGKYILVDISEQHMYVYEGDTLVYSFVVSTGMNNATRVGKFEVLDKIDNAYGANWNIWMPNWMGIYWSGSLENGIHALPILPSGAQLWEGYLGTPISYGCIVLSAGDAQLLYDWAEVGTTVEIIW